MLLWLNRGYNTFKTPGSNLILPNFEPGILNIAIAPSVP